MPFRGNLSESLDSTCVDASRDIKVNSSIWTHLFGKGLVSKDGFILNSKKSAIILTDYNLNIFENTFNKTQLIPLATGQIRYKEFIWYVYLMSKTHVLGSVDLISRAKEIHMTPYPNEFDLNTPSYMEHLFLAQESLHYDDLNITLLEKAVGYIDNPSNNFTEYQDQYSAFMNRKERYIGQVTSNNWKGYPIDFTFNSNVIPVIKGDLNVALISARGMIDKLLSFYPYYNYTPLSTSRDIYHPLFFHPCFMFNINHNEILLKLRMGSIIDNDKIFTDWLLREEKDFSDSIDYFSKQQIQGYIWAMESVMSTWPVEANHLD